MKRSFVMARQKALQAAYYRGGTSRAIIFERKDLPLPETGWKAVFQKVMGSPDPYARQLDGLGAGISSLSKICVVAPHTSRGSVDVDIDYTFYAVGVKEDEVDVAGNCGNMSAAIGPYAWEHGLLDRKRVQDGKAVCHILNTNTNKIISATFEVDGDEAEVHGDYMLDGVTGRGSCINLDFHQPSGAKTGQVLPTGSITDDFYGLKVNCIDVGNPCVFVRAYDLGLDGPKLPDEMLEVPDLLRRLEKLRHAAAVRMGLIREDEETARTVPKVCIVSRPVTHQILSGEKQGADSVDVIIRVISDRQPHRAIPLTATVCSAAAAKMEGSIVNESLWTTPVKDGVITIGHSSGRIEAAASVDAASFDVRSVSVFRTARRLMEGTVYYD